MRYGNLYPEKRDWYGLRKYSAIVLDMGSASMIIAGGMMKDVNLVAIGGSFGLPAIFSSYDIFTEQRKIRRKEREEMMRFLENQKPFE